MNQFMKGALAGGIGAAAVIAISSALAGSGPGGIFNLGVDNTVSRTSTLRSTQAYAGPQVAIDNTAGGGAALDLKVGARAAPFTVNSSKVVGNLNADQLNGRHASGWSRVTQGGQSTWGLNGVTEAADQTVTVVVPTGGGWIELHGSVLADDVHSPTACTLCTVEMRLKDETADAFSPQAMGVLVSGGPSYLSLSQTWVFPVTAGTRTFSVVTGQSASGGPAVIDNPVLTAQYLPYGYNGGTALAP